VIGDRPARRYKGKRPRKKKGKRDQAFGRFVFVAPPPARCPSGAGAVTGQEEETARPGKSEVLRGAPRTKTRRIIQTPCRDLVCGSSRSTRIGRDCRTTTTKGHLVGRGAIGVLFCERESDQTTGAEPGLDVVPASARPSSVSGPLGSAAAGLCYLAILFLRPGRGKRHLSVLRNGSLITCFFGENLAAVLHLGCGPWTKSF